MAFPKVPSIGRIVHYVAYGTPGGEYKPEHHAAIITALPGPTIDIVCLCVINPAGPLFFNMSVPYDSSCNKGGTWHWPEISTGELQS